MKAVNVIVSVGAAYIALGIASAQTQTGSNVPPTTNVDAASDPQDIVVTARKRAENAFDVPVAITAVNAQALQEKNIASVSDLTKIIPNISFSDTGGDSGKGSSVIFIRGVGQTDYANAADPGVGTYVDGVYLGRTIGGAIDLPDVAQVEVLRGPQGTLFGKNTMGGAINITTKRPSFGNDAIVQLTLGERNRINLDSEVDLGLTDTLAIHGAFATRHQDGFVKRANGGNALGNEDTQIVRLKAEYKPNDRWSVLLSGDYSEIGGTTARVITKIDPTNSLAFLWNNVPPALIANVVSGGLVPPNPALGFTPYSVLAGQRIDASYATTDLRRTNAAGSYDFSFKGGGGSARIEGKLSDALTVRSITAYRGFTSTSDSDQDGQSIDWGQVSYTDKQDQFSQELNVIGTGLNGRLDYIVGGYYFREAAKAYQKIDLAAPLLLFQNDFATRTSSYAAFTEASYKVLPHLTVTGGVRYTKEDRDFTAQTACRPGTVLPVCFGGFYLPPTATSKSFESTDPRAVLRYEVDRSLMLYASFSRGFKSGGFNARANTAAQVLPYKPEHVNAFELGSKGNIGRGLLTFSAAAFYYDYSDLQVTATGSDPTGTSIAFVGNIKARVKGAEFEGVLHPTRLFQIDGSVGYTHGTIVSIPTTLNAFFVNSGLKPITTSNNLPKTPEWTVNVGALLRTPLGSGEIRWRADYNWVSAQDSDIQNFRETRSPAHHNIDARITYQPDHAGWSVAVYGKNLTDEAYVVNGFYPNGGAGAQVFSTPNKPREIGVVLRAEFGK